MHRPTLLAVAVAAPLAGCLPPSLVAAIPPSLTTEGAAVRVVDAVDPQCQPVGRVIGLFQTDGQRLTVVDDALLVTRNNAAELGADTLVVDPPQVTATPDSTSAVYLGTGYRCWPKPVGAYLLGVVTEETAVRPGPDRQLPVRRTLAPGTRVEVSDTFLHGFRRVRFLDGGPTGFIAADAAVDLVRGLRRPPVTTREPSSAVSPAAPPPAAPPPPPPGSPPPPPR